MPVRLLGLVVSAVLAVPVFPLAPGDDSQSLTVSPSHGVWTAPFTITYTYTFGYLNPMHCMRDEDSFIMDQIVIEHVPEVYADGVCTARVTVNLPGPTDQYDRIHMYTPGPHLIRSTAGLTTTYTIDPGPSPTFKPSPTHAPAPARTTSRPAPTTAPVSPSAAPTDAAVSPSPSVEPSTDPPSATVGALAAAVPAPSADASFGGTSTTPWVVAGASVLVLGGGLLGLLVLRRRRAPVGPGPDADTLEA